MASLNAVKFPSNVISNLGFALKRHVSIAPLEEKPHAEADVTFQDVALRIRGQSRGRKAGTASVISPLALPLPQYDGVAGERKP